MNPNLTVLIYHAMASINPLVRETERDEFLEYVSELEGFIALKSIGYFRKAYRDAIPDGQSVLEMSNQTAAKEVEALINEVVAYGH